MPESIWKLVFYSCTWSWSLYLIVLSGRYKVFHDPLSIWDDWHYNVEVPWDIYVAYIWQASFYLHSLYATVNMDIWRKDSILMIVHHFLTLALIGFSYALRHHMIGVLVLLLHDINDIELEITKLNTYLKRRNDRYYGLNDIVAGVAFVSFAISWFLFRLYWFPLKVMYMSLYGSVNMGPPEVPFIPLFNGMLLLLFAMNVYWFHFILLLVWRLLTGKADEVGDTREIKRNQIANLPTNIGYPSEKINGDACNVRAKQAKNTSSTAFPLKPFVASGFRIGSPRIQMFVKRMAVI